MSLAGAVMAGGRASRFGADKTRLLLGGQSLAAHLLSQMALAGLGPLALSAAEPPQDLPLGVRLVADKVAGQGPLGGLASLLDALGQPVLVAAGDMPGLEAVAFMAMRKAWTPGRGGLVALGPDGLHPLFAIYEPSCLPAMRAALDQGRGAVHQVVQSLDLPQWLVPENAWLANVNTPKDWEAWSLKRPPL